MQTLNGERGIGADWADVEVLDALAADLRAVGGDGHVSVRRRAVAVRLLARGLRPTTLEAVLPGWSRYLDPN